MLQIVDDREVFVVDFDTMPELPITWITFEERPYAEALQDAIQHKIITEPGKYGIAIEKPLAPNVFTYTIFAIIEE
jgi:hypothetical protein